jgi:hypothetical protein
MARRPTKEADDDAKLQGIRDVFDYNFRKWDPIYKEGDTDMRFVSGDPWEPEDKQAREDAGRPALAFDELGQYINQAVNDVRANPVSARFSPTGEGASDETARFYEALDRETEYRSNGLLAETTAFENMLQRSFGFVRIKADFEHPRSMYQHLVIDSLPNAACFYPDADGIRPDGSDWRNADFIETYSRAEFKRAFPRAKYQSFSSEQIQVAGDKWGGEDRVQVAEHWELEMVEGILVQCEVPATRMAPARIVEYIDGVDRKPRGSREVQRRATEVPKVSYCLTNGLELLAKVDGTTIHKWAGDSIPFASCYGKILWMNKGSGADRVILSMTRLARNPYMAYCFSVTNLIEAIGMITKNPYFAYEGTLDQPQMDEIAKSMHEPVAVLLSKPFIEGSQQLMPLLQRNPLSVDLSSYSVAAEMCRRAIQAAMGWTPLPTDAQKRNQKSGIALQKIEESGQRGAYHFKDAYYMMLRRGAEIRENLYDRLYDTPRDVNVRQKDNTQEQWRINDKSAQGERTLPSIKGRHSVTIDIGPEYTSEREAANAFIDQFVTSPLMQALEPAKRDKLIGMAIKARNIGVYGDKMADIVSPPEDKTGQPDPQQAIALLKQAQQQIIPALQQENQELKSGMAAKQMEVESRERIAQQADQTKREIAGAQSSEKMAIAQLQADVDRMKVTLDNKVDLIIATLNAQKGIVDVAHDAAKTVAQRAHEVGMAEQTHMHGIESQTQSEAAAERQTAQQQQSAEE